MMKRYIPWTILAVFVAYVAVSLFDWRATSRDGFEIAKFGRLPVALGGRVRPIDSVARMGLVQVRGTAEVPLADGAGRFAIGGASLSATEWLLEVLIKPDVADSRRIFPIGEPALVSKLHLQPAAGGYYSFKEITPHNAEVSTEANRAGKVAAAKRAPWEQEVVALRLRLASYERLKNSLQANSLLQQEAKGAPLQYDMMALLTTYRANLAESARVAARRKSGGKDTLDTQKAADMMTFARPFAAVSRIGVIAMIPPARPGDSRDGWKNVGAAIVDSARSGRLPAPVTHVTAITSAFAHGKPDAFNRLVDVYGQWLASNALGPSVRRARYESFYNLLQPYVKAVVFYLVALILICAAWWSGSETLYRSGMLVAGLGIAVQSAGLLLDMMLSGRLPVHSLLGWIALSGWALACGALALERSHRFGRGRAAAIGTSLALAALVTAHALVPGGTTMLVAGFVDVRFVVAMLVALLVLPLARDRAVEAPVDAAPVPA